MTLNDLEQRNSFYFAFLIHRIRLLCWPSMPQWLKMETYNVRKYCLPVLAFHFWP